jgi:regulator of sirC expression with transglutaminase-like and TPR domain
MTRTLASELFREMVSRPAGEVDLAAAALLIALDEYPDLNLQEYLLRIDQLAEGIRPELQGSGSVAERPVDAIEKVNQHLFAVEGFRGNRDDYYDPRNSFLNEVLDRRTGIPITLSVIYMEVGKRLGLELQGVGMPGHFVVKCRHRDIELFVDPFNFGEILLEADCQKKLAQIHGQDFRFDRSHLDSVNNHQILTRMLTNLKAIYFEKQDYSRTLAMIEKILLVNPNAPDEIRDRGFIHYKLDHLSQALKDWSRYLELSPRASDAKEIERNLTVAGHLLAGRN